MQLAILSDQITEVLNKRTCFSARRPLKMNARELESLQRLVHVCHQAQLFADAVSFWLWQIRLQPFALASTNLWRVISIAVRVLIALTIGCLFILGRFPCTNTFRIFIRWQNKLCISDSLDINQSEFLQCWFRFVDIKAFWEKWAQYCRRFSFLYVAIHQYDAFQALLLLENGQQKK